MAEEHTNFIKMQKEIVRLLDQLKNHPDMKKDYYFREHQWASDMRLNKEKFEKEKEKFGMDALLKRSNKVLKYLNYLKNGWGKQGLKEDILELSGLVE